MAARVPGNHGSRTDSIALELPPLPPIDLVGHEDGNPVAAEARDAASYEAVCELASTWRSEQSEEAAAAAEEELAFAQVCAWYVHGMCMLMHGLCMVCAWPLRRTVASGTPRNMRGYGKSRRGGSELAALTLTLIMTFQPDPGPGPNPNQVELAAQAPPPSAVELRAQRATLQA